MTPPPPVLAGWRSATGSSAVEPGCDHPRAGLVAAGRRRCHCEELLCLLPCPPLILRRPRLGCSVHAVCVINIEGKVLSQFIVEHSAAGIALLVRRLAKFGEPIDIPIGIERPDGRLVDLLLEAGHPVVPVSPTRSRPGARARCSPAPNPMPPTPP